MIQGYIAGDAISPNYYPANYLGEIDAFYASPFGCDRPAKLTYADLALQQNRFATAMYRGVDLQGRMALGRHLLLQSYYGITAATPAVAIYGSTISPANQILGVPLQKYGALVDWRNPSDSAEIVASAQLLSGNSISYLRPYTTFGVGTRIRMAHGDVIASVSNLFDSLSPAFGSPAIGENVGRVGVPPITLVGLPLAPRSFQVSYHVLIGRIGGALISSGNPDEGLPTSTTLTAAPLSTLGKSDPFEINRNNPQCGPEGLRYVTEIFSALRGYVNGATPVPYKTLPEGEYAYARRADDGRYAFLIGGTRPAVEIALLSCAVVHAGTAFQAQAAGIYVPSTSDKDFDLVFMPKMGFYLTYDRANSIQRKNTEQPLRKNVTPSSRNQHPFSITGSAASCAPDIRGAASYVLQQLSSYFQSGSMGETDGVSITAHASPKPWYEISFDDAETVTAIEACATVFQVTREQEKAFGIGSSRAGTIDFAPPIGLYVGGGST